MCIYIRVLVLAIYLYNYISNPPSRPRVDYWGDDYQQRTHLKDSNTLPRDQNLLGLGVCADGHLRASARDLGGVEGWAAVVGEFAT